MIENRLAAVVGKTEDFSDEAKRFMVDRSIMNILGYTEEDLGKLQDTVRLTWIERKEEHIWDDIKFKNEKVCAQEIFGHLEETKKSLRKLTNTISNYYGGAR